MSFWQRSPAFSLLPPLGDQPGPARPVSDAELDELIESTLDLADLEPEDEPIPHVWRRPRKRHVWKMAAATVLALGGIAAAAATTAHVITERRAAVAPPHVSAPSRRIQRPTKPRPLVIEPLGREEVPAPEARSTPAASRDLLAQANQMRRRREWSRAERLYTTIIRDFSGTDEAYAASVAAASLRLEHLDDTEGALALFSAAWRARPDGALAEEALYGIADAARALGRWRGERRALTLFLERFPKSMRRARIQQRLGEIEELVP